jgi:hypothetical protein
MGYIEAAPRAVDIASGLVRVAAGCRRERGWTWGTSLKGAVLERRQRENTTVPAHTHCQQIDDPEEGMLEATHTARGQGVACPPGPRVLVAEDGWTTCDFVLLACWGCL